MNKHLPANNLLIHGCSTLSKLSQFAVLSVIRQSVFIFLIYCVSGTYSNLAAQMIADKDSDGLVDFGDMDSDNDGISDEDEGVQCELVDLQSQFPGGSLNALEDFNNAMITVGGVNGALIQVDTTFRGGASLDEFEISNRHTGNEFGLLLGVNSNDPSQTLSEIYSFSKLVCDFSVTIWDLDRTDAINVFGTNGGTPVPFTLTNVGSCIGYDGMNQLESTCNNQVEPGDGNILDHVFTLQFDGCIDSLRFQYFDQGPGNGGSFTFVPTPFPTCLGPDTDGDGIPDALDLDSDNDGIPDAIEACGDISLLLENCSLDDNGDGVYQMENGESTGILVEVCPDAPIDTDGDGIPDFLDLDSDGDGCPDATEACTNSNPNVNDSDISDGYQIPSPEVDACGLVVDTDGISVSCVTPPSENWTDNSIGCLSADIALVQNVQCFNANDGSATANPIDGNAPYTFLWMPSDETTATAVMLEPGVNSVTITDDCGQTFISDVTISEPTGLSASSTQIDVTCFNESTGSIDLTPSGGTPSYTFMWNDNITTEDRTDIPAGNYSVLITDDNGCQIVSEFTIAQPQPIAVDIQIGCEMTFFPGCDADLDYTVTGGLGPYTVTITDENGILVPPNEAGPNWSNLCDGQYDINITDSANCNTTESFLVCALSCDLMLEQGTIENVSCNGFSDGSVTVIGTSSSLPITYQWEQAGNPFGTGESQSNLTAGVYKVIATDAIGCLEELTFVVDEPAQLTIGNCIVQNVTTFMGSEGSVEIPVDGGTQAYSFSWSNGGITNPITDLPAGDYAVTVTDMNGCSTESMCTVQPLSCANFNATPNSTNISCNGGNDGEINITVLGATGVVSYTWTPNVSNANSATGLTAGAYEIQVIDEALCAETIMITLTEPTLLNAEIDKEDVICFGNMDGNMDLQVSGGVEPFSFIWSNGVTLEDQEGVGPGTYSVSVTDANLCTVTSEVTVTEPTDLVLTFEIVDVTCNGEETGEIDITVSGGTPGYTFNWADGVMTEDRTDLPAGNYTILVNDANGCAITQEITISEPASLAIDIQIGCEMTFFPGGDAVLTYAISGGFPEYTVTITDSLGVIVPPNEAGPNWSNLSDGQYDIMVIDAANCATTESFLVCSLSCDLELEAGTTINVSCTNGSDGSATVIGTSSAQPITYAWEQAGVTFGTGTSQSGLPAGVYKVIAEDAIGCLEELTFVIDEPTQLVITNCASEPVSTVGGSDGSANVTVAGGTESYTYLWSNGSTTNPAINLEAGEYTVTVTDALGCTAETPCTVQPKLCETFSASANGENISCNGGDDGEITINVSGADGNINYTWTPNVSSSATASNLSAGQYQIFVQDAALCNETVQITLTEPTALNAEIDKEDVICFGESTGNMDLQVSGGIEPYTFEWSNGSTEEDQKGVAIGTYSVTVTDANDCTISASVIVNEPPLLECFTTADVNAICSLANGQATVRGDGGVAPYGFLWDNGETTPTASSLTSGLHSVTINDSNGCSQVCTVTIGETCNPCLELTKASSLSLGSNGSANPLDTITYTYVVTNCGDVTITDISILEEGDAFTGTGILPIPNQPSPNTLAPNESVTVKSTYLITQTDINTSFVDNQATAAGSDPDGNPVIDLSDTANPNDINETGGPDDPTNTPISEIACIELTKSSIIELGSDGIATPGDVINYFYIIRNCGNVTLADLQLSETNTGFSGTGSLPMPSELILSTLTPGQSTTSRSTYNITQIDIDNGFVDNQATVSGLDPSLSVIEDLSDTRNANDVNETGGPDDPTNTPISEASCVSILKRSSLRLGNDMTATPGDVITYRYEIFNCGNVTLTDVTIIEQNGSFSGTGILPLPSSVTPSIIAPGESGIAMAQYEITQEDIDTGFINNQAQTNAQTPGVETVMDISDTSNENDVNETGGDNDPTNTPIPESPCITITKGSILDLGSNGVANTLDEITYTYVITNCGNVTLSDVSVSENEGNFTGTGNLPIIEATNPAILAPGESVTTSSTYLITQADINNGSIDNQAIATGIAPDGDSTDDLSDTSNPNDINETGGPDDPTNTPIGESTCLEITKSSFLTFGVDGIANEGDVITYFYIIRNCGNVTISNIELEETVEGFTGTGILPTPSAPALISLIPGQSSTSTSMYTVTQADIDVGFVDNQATVSGQNPDGLTTNDLSDTRNIDDVNETGGSDDPTNTPLPEVPCIVLTKGSVLDLGPNNDANVGDLVNYNYVVTNCGNVTLENVSVIENGTSFTGSGILPVPGQLTNSTLIPGQSETVFSTYIITQVDIDNGEINNQATASGIAPDGGQVNDLSDTSNNNDKNETGGNNDPTNTPIGESPCIEITKSSTLDLGPDLTATPGDEVTYSYVITNCGNVSLVGVQVTESQSDFSGSGDLPIPSTPILQRISPGQSTTAFATYIITQEDIDAGFINNQAIATGNDPFNNVVSDESDTTNPDDPNDTGGPNDPTYTPVPQSPCIESIKSSFFDLGPDGLATRGDTIFYSYSIKNCGNVTLNNLTISEEELMFSGTGDLPVPSILFPMSISPGKQALSTSTYIVTQQDLDAGFVDNQVIVSGTGPSGESTEDLSDTGNLDDVNETGGPDDPTNTQLEENPCIEITKSSLFDIGGNGIANAGDRVQYFYIIRNCGNVTLSDISIIESADNFTGTGNLPIPSSPIIQILSPGQSIASSSSYTVTQADVNTGFIDNQAIATGNDPSGASHDDLSDTRNVNDVNETGGPDDPTNTPLEQDPCLELIKFSELDMGADGVANVGDSITYSYLLRNCGNVTINNISITEEPLLFSGSGALPTPTNLSSTVLTPGQTANATAIYALSQIDIDAGGINNQALAAGTSPNNQPVSDLSDTGNDNDPNETGGPDDPTFTPIEQVPCVSLTKGSFLSLGIDGIPTDGDIISYTYVVRNCGNVTLSNIGLSELDNAFTGSGSLPVIQELSTNLLAPGQSVTSSSTYTISQDDIDAGFIDNQALVSANSPQGNDISDLSDTSNPNDINETGGPNDPTNTPIQGNACLELIKSSFLDLGNDGVANPGDIITYSYSISNCGNVTLSNISLEELASSFTGAGALPIPGSIDVVLNPNESTSISVDYSIVQADVDANQIDNQAFVSAVDPAGNTVDDLSDTGNPNDVNETGGADDPTNTPIGPNPCIELLKGSEFMSTNGAEGIINYTYTIRNCGNVTLLDVNLSETAETFSGTGILPNINPANITQLQVGESVIATASYTITRDDVDMKFVDNQAIVEASDPSGQTVSDLSDTTNPNDINETGGPNDPTNTPINITSTVSGTVFEDIDGNTIEDIPIEGVIVTIIDSEGNVQMDITDQNGNYEFTGIIPGEYTITESDPSGFNSVSDSDGNNDNVITGFIEPAANNTNNDFIDEEPGTIAGQVTNDVDNDQLGDIPLVGVIITLIDRDGVEFTTITDINGEYSFENINPGLYTLIETDPEDFESVTDADGGDPNVINNILFSGEINPDEDFVDAKCDELVCNGDLQISLNVECELELSPDDVLENPAPGIYTIQLFDEQGEYIRDNVLTADEAGETIKYQISCLENSCWGSIIVEANIIPQIDSPCACTEDGSIPEDCQLWCGPKGQVPSSLVSPEEAAAKFGFCGPDLLGEIKVVENRTGDLCSEDGEIVELIYTGKVIQHGQIREVDILCQRYTTLKLDLDTTTFSFPIDVILDCDYLNEIETINIEDAIDYESGSPESIAASTEDVTFAYPYYIDMHDTILDIIKIYDTTQVVVGQILRDTMIKEDIGGQEEWVLHTIVDKIYEDSISTRLDTLGKTNPAVPIVERVCNILSSYTDVPFEACGEGTKIIRSWELIDWCDGMLSLSGRQTIEIIDTSAPVVVELMNGEYIPVDTYDDILISIEPWNCSAKVRLPQLTILDNCDTDPIVNWDTDEGRVENGFIVDLWLSQSPIPVKGTVEDDCGNTTDVQFNFIVIDDVPPVASCETSLQVSLTGSASGAYGLADVNAVDLDEGSHDSGCGKVKLSVVRVEDWRIPVRDCQGEIIGFEPVSCSANTQDIDQEELSAKDDCQYTEDNINQISVAGESVRFCCEDFGKIIPVILFIEDEAGNVNQCIVNVEVVDKSAPVLQCKDVVVSCVDGDHLAPPATIGAACDREESLTVALLNEIRNNNSCAGGQVIREWFIDLDNSDDYSPGDSYCRQIVTVDAETSFNPYTIKWPKHYDGKQLAGLNLELNEAGETVEIPTTVSMGESSACIPDQVSDKPVWCDTECGLVGYTMMPDTIKASDACLKIIQRWSIVDWCTYDSNGTDTDDENDTSSDSFEAIEDWVQFEENAPVCPEYASNIGDAVYFRYNEVEKDGYYTFDQVIVVIDDTAPEIESPDTYLVNTIGGANTKDDNSICYGESIVTASASDLCGGNYTGANLLQWHITVSKDGQEIASKTVRGPEASMSSQVGSPGDTHIISWRVKDGCGNATVTQTVVTYGDEQAPTPFCVGGISTAFMQSDGSVTVWGNEFDFGSFDNCTEEENLRFSLVINGEEPIRPNDIGFENQAGLEFHCRDYSNYSELDMWVWDEVGNGDFCAVAIVISDNGNLCPEEEENGSGAGVMVAGQIMTSYGMPIDNVRVRLSSTDLLEYPRTTFTTNDGQYTFENNPLGFNYSLKADKQDEYLNGLSTLDLVFISRHVIALESFTDPYKIIAADASWDGKVSALDLTALRQLILGTAVQLNNISPWVFVDQNQRFVDSTNPWPFVDQIDVTNLGEDEMGEDFIAIKIGDVNESYDAVESRFRGELTFNIDNQFVLSGETVRVEFTASNFDKISGFQYTLAHKGLELVNVEKGHLDISDANIGKTDQQLTMSWHDANLQSVDQNSILFSLILKATKDISIHDALVIHSGQTKAEAYQNVAYDLLDVDLHVDQNGDHLELFQNLPNPFETITTIGFKLPTDSDISLSIFTIDGRELRRIKSFYSKGRHEIKIDAKDLDHKGVMYYQLRSGETIITKKMIAL